MRLRPPSYLVLCAGLVVVRLLKLLYCLIISVMFFNWCGCSVSPSLSVSLSLSPHLSARALAASQRLLMSVIKGCLKEDSKELKKLVMMYWEVVKKYDAEGKLLPEMILVWYIVRACNRKCLRPVFVPSTSEKCQAFRRLFCASPIPLLVPRTFCCCSFAVVASPFLLLLLLYVHVVVCECSLSYSSHFIFADVLRSTHQ